MKYKKTITVNDLNDILQKHFRARHIFIESVECGDITKQFSPRKINIGAGGVLNITFESSKKLKS